MSASCCSGRQTLCSLPLMANGRTVVLDGTWSDPGYRERARRTAADATAPMVEFVCVAPLDSTVNRIASRAATTSQVTPEIATALASRDTDHRTWPQAHPIDTTREPAEVSASALAICRTT